MLFQISKESNRKKVKALYLDTDEHFVLTAQPVLRATPMLFEPKHVQAAISPNTFIAQEDGIFSKAALTTFWSRIFFFTKHSYTTLKFWR